MTDFDENEDLNPMDYDLKPGEEKTMTEQELMDACRNPVNGILEILGIQLDEVQGLLPQKLIHRMLNAFRDMSCGKQYEVLANPIFNQEGATVSKADWIKGDNALQEETRGRMEKWVDNTEKTFVSLLNGVAVDMFQVVQDAGVFNADPKGEDATATIPKRWIRLGHDKMCCLVPHEAVDLKKVIEGWKEPDPVAPLATIYHVLVSKTEYMNIADKIGTKGSPVSIDCESPDGVGRVSGFGMIAGLDMLQGQIDAIQSGGIGCATVGVVWTTRPHFTLEKVIEEGAALSKRAHLASAGLDEHGDPVYRSILADDVLKAGKELLEFCDNGTPEPVGMDTRQRKLIRLLSKWIKQEEERIREEKEEDIANREKEREEYLATQFKWILELRNNGSTFRKVFDDEPKKEEVKQWRKEAKEYFRLEREY